jgi:endonuclease G
MRRIAVFATLSLAMLVAQEGAQAGILKRLAVISAVGVASHAYASRSNGQAPADLQTAQGSTGPASCTSQLAGGRQPTFAKESMASGLQVICNQEYTVGYSPKTRTPLWSAEHLTRQRIEAARATPRKNTFHEELGLPPEARASLKDFVRSGYDRGHLSPSADFTTASAQNESFSLANMIPQDPKNNQHLWEGIESGTRNFAMSNGSVYVITGPLFTGQKTQFLRDRVAIPSQIFKVLYDPVHRTGGVYLVDNIDTQEIAWKSIAEFEQSSGYRFNLGSPALMQMPQPRQHF